MFSSKWNWFLVKQMKGGNFVLSHILPYLLLLTCWSPEEIFNFLVKFYMVTWQQILLTKQFWQNADESNQKRFSEIWLIVHLLQLLTHLHSTKHIMCYEECKQKRKSKISMKDTDRHEIHTGFKKFWTIDLSADGGLLFS